MILGYILHPKDKQQGGTGGSAIAEGKNSSAEGGEGGKSTFGIGGSGGHAVAKGHGATAIGGRGGDA